MTSHQQIRCIVLSDTHDLDNAFPTESSVTKADLILHCGDMTQIGGLSNYRRALQEIEAIKDYAGAELALVIAGNHDVSLDPSWWAENLDEDEDDPEEPARARALFDQASKRGVYLLNEGLHKFALQDGRSFSIFASPFTPEFGGYAFAYPESDDHFNTGSSTIPTEGVDIVMTHGPPRPDVAAAAEQYYLDIGHKGQHCGCPKLFKAIQRAKPTLHCFGHIHEGHGAQVLSHHVVQQAEVTLGTLEKEKQNIVKARGGDGETLLLNAAIQAQDGINKPWVVDVEVKIN